MINKKNLLKIFIIFFIAISNILICNISNAKFKINNNNITVYENQTTTITIETDQTLTSNHVVFKYDAVHDTYIDKGAISCSIINSTRKGMMTTLTVEVKGVKTGHASRHF